MFGVCGDSLSVGRGGFGIGGGWGIVEELSNKFNFGTVKLLFIELRLKGDLDDNGDTTVSCFEGDKRLVGIRDGENVDCVVCRLEFGDK